MCVLSPVSWHCAPAVCVFVRLSLSSSSWPQGSVLSCRFTQVTLSKVRARSSTNVRSMHIYIHFILVLKSPASLSSFQHGNMCFFEHVSKLSSQQFHMTGRADCLNLEILSSVVSSARVQVQIRAQLTGAVFEFLMIISSGLCLDINTISDVKWNRATYNKGLGLALWFICAFLL